MAAIMFMEQNHHLHLEKGFSSKEDLGNIEVYVYHKIGMPRRQVFLIMEDQQGMREVIELEQKGIKEGYPYRIYAPSLNQSVRLQSGIVTLKIMLLTIGSTEYFMSNPITLTLTTSHYNLTRQVYLSQELGAKVHGYYSKIVELFEQLIVEKGEHLHESDNHS